MKKIAIERLWRMLWKTQSHRYDTIRVVWSLLCLFE